MPSPPKLDHMKTSAKGPATPKWSTRVPQRDLPFSPACLPVKPTSQRAAVATGIALALTVGSDGRGGKPDE